ncbi:MAG TPA: glucose-6-phosphate dehydrogenase assembly protein OpcA [bacterium]|nr:glucose-6-phosphate dehydrogenase assembly protein OpcA [bacterium]
MAAALNVTSVAGVPERVDVGAIERELHRLWSSLDTETHGAGTAGAHVTRICTLTLLAVAPNGHCVETATAADRLATRYPSRSIILDLAPHTTGPVPNEGTLTVELALNCHTPGPQRPAVCCEQIVVSASGRALARVPGLVLPLLVPNLPVYLWWPDDVPVAHEPSTGTTRPEPLPPPEADLLRRLAENADVLIVDSSAMRHPTAGLKAASALAGPLSGGLRDLTWGRITPWRDLIVQCFDPAPMRAALERLDRIKIRAAPGQSEHAVPIAGLLLGGWLAGRLGWEPAGSARRDGRLLRALFWRDGGGLELVVEGGSGPVLSFECAAGGGEPCAVSIARQSAGEAAVQIETRLGRGRPRATAAALALADDTVLVGAEFEVSGVDSVLREALEVVLRLMEGVS